LTADGSPLRLRAAKEPLPRTSSTQRRKQANLSPFPQDKLNTDVNNRKKNHASRQMHCGEAFREDVV
ncbi:hypothetical protein AVEN_220251-1, partial [Araneus ventricosus]